jgi:cystathionine gamma-synthase
MTGNRPRPETLAIHVGRPPRTAHTPLNPPIALASNFYTEHYAREEGSPAWQPLEEAIGQLEGGSTVAFASGRAAIAAVVEDLAVGARVVGPLSGYKWTRTLLHDHHERGRIHFEEVDTSDAEATVRACEGADLLWLESPTNPLVRVCDLAGICTGAAAAGVPVAVDSTFATPLLQQPLAFGATYSIHSASKFIGGHSDLLLGVATTNDETRLRRLRHVRAQLGATPGSLEAWLALRGLRTLPVRLESAQRNAMELATRLAAHPNVSRVYYPGLPDDAGHEVASKQMSGFGAMLAFEVMGSAAEADAVCAGVRIITHAKSLGGVESLIERRARSGGEAAPESLLRLSVGCEHIEDLWEDLDQALTTRD